MAFVSSADSLTATVVLALALAATAAGILSILAFILMRRLIRSRYFRRRDRLALSIRSSWKQIVTGQTPASQWFLDPMAREIVEEIVLDRMDAAVGEELRELESLLRASGLLDRQIREARGLRGWRRRKALLTLGRIQLPECVPALIEALEDGSEEVAIDAIRALGRIGNPRAGEALFRRISRRALHCPAANLENALVNCYRGDPSGLLALVLEAEDAHRPALARALAGIAAPGIPGDLLPLAVDPLPDVRASAARVLASARPPGAFEALSELAGDEEWFVRLRAVVALRELGDPATIPILIRGLCDSNRLVRLRAASALASMEGSEERILHLAKLTRDRYAMQALVSEMERSGKITRLVEMLAVEERRPAAESVLRMAAAGGTTRIIVNLMSKAHGAAVQQNLARILAQSGDSALLSYVEQVYVTADEGGQQALHALVAAIHQASGAPQEAPPA